MAKCCAKPPTSVMSSSPPKTCDYIKISHLQLSAAKPGYKNLPVNDVDQDHMVNGMVILLL